MLSFNDISLILVAIPVTSVFTDACDVGAHWCCVDDWQTMHINLKEVESVTLAAHRWAHLWSNKRILIWSYNMTTVSSVNRCTSKDT